MSKCFSFKKQEKIYILPILFNVELQSLTSKTNKKKYMNLNSRNNTTCLNMTGLCKHTHEMSSSYHPQLYSQ